MRAATASGGPAPGTRHPRPCSRAIAANEELRETGTQPEAIPPGSPCRSSLSRSGSRTGCRGGRPPGPRERARALERDPSARGSGVLAQPRLVAAVGGSPRPPKQLQTESSRRSRRSPSHRSSLDPLDRRDPPDRDDRGVIARAVLGGAGSALRRRLGRARRASRWGAESPPRSRSRSGRRQRGPDEASG